jgi:hypothetical protein
MSAAALGEASAPCRAPGSIEDWRSSARHRRKDAAAALYPTITETGMATILLLTISNVFMTLAWYGHLKYKESALWKVILVSWLIAFVEYCFQVPANRIGHYQFSAAQLKVMQEVITLVVFAVFSVMYLKEELRWNYVVGFLFLLGAVLFVFGFRRAVES